MTLSFAKNLPITGNDLGLMMNSVRWRGIFPIVRRISNWATFPWGMVDVLREQQLSARWLIFQKLSTLISGIVLPELNIVILGNYRPLWAHYKILVAYDEQNGLGFIDPAYPKGEVYWDSFHYFEKHWRKFGCQVIRVRL